ncbi:hypothetical protein Vadar_022325 [Vaccinium darrowii]|uniref:Uncharacterized protein n=1 Tax=Vaccinium darrowii TaxID=229202 RepID=A0ACB7X2U1_9ERIC|nr:hypothetical protein Vadar_022325 [Vaccinium darrowii]
MGALSRWIVNQGKNHLDSVSVFFSDNWRSSPRYYPQKQREESEQESSEEINELDYSTSSESEYSPPEECTGKCCSSHQDPLKVFANLNGLSINVLSKSQQDILDLVDKVQDPEIRRKIIELSLNSTISEAEPSEKPPNNTKYYSINEVFSRLEAKSSKPATLQDLQKEVNELKSELRLLKTSQLEQQDPSLFGISTHPLISIDSGKVSISGE